MKILICPLNWGLGHASRCIPLIRGFMSDGHEVCVVADGFPLRLLQNQFPDLRFIDYPSYPVRYSSGSSQIAAMLVQVPGFLYGIYAEHRWLKRLLKKENFDLVVSDNRFGMWNKSVRSVYMTHQIMIKMPQPLKRLESLVYRIHRLIIHRYNECWIPDRAEDGGLSGDLSHLFPLPSNARFIGALSRFSLLENICPNDTYSTIVILSGPEPQRSLLEQALCDEFQTHQQPVLIIQGLPQEKVSETSIGAVRLVSHLPDDQLAAHCLGARQIICRSGYSTIMDLDALNCIKKARFIPTPGQTEQEYLAKYFRQQQ